MLENTKDFIMCFISYKFFPKKKKTQEQIKNMACTKSVQAFLLYKKCFCKSEINNKGNYINLHQMIADDGRLCPVLFQTYSVQATRGLLTGLTPSRDNVFYYSLGKTMESIRQ